MRHRLIDIALIVGLVLVAGAIVWTLFSLGRDPAPGPGPDAGPAIETPAPTDEEADGGNGVVPVAPGSPAAEGDGADATDTAEGGDAADDAEGGEDTADADGEDGAVDGEDAVAGDEGEDGAQDADAGPIGGPDPDVPAAEAPPLPDSGPVDLGRIGFSYVTGGAGACGIVLEPWEHVAVSREMLEAYGCGAEVRITLDDETAGRSAFDAVIADTMNPAFSRTVNIYVGQDEPALEFGLTTGTLLPQ